MGLGQQKIARVLDEFFHLHEELHSLTAVDDPVIVAEGEVHHWSYDDLAVDWDGPVGDLVQPEDAHLGRIEDGRAHERAEDTAVRDGERAAAEVLERERAVLRAR